MRASCLHLLNFYESGKQVKHVNSADTHTARGDALQYSAERINPAARGDALQYLAEHINPAANHEIVWKLCTTRNAPVDAVSTMKL
jgi:hypothetical protein